MDKEEARTLLAAELVEWRNRSYAELVAKLGESHHTERAGQNGALYQIEMEVMWDYKPGGDVRVIGSVDDGGWSAFVPLTISFVLSPSGEFVGE